MHLLLVLAALTLPPQHTIEGTAVVRDYSHPKHAGDFHEERLRLTIAADAERNALAIAFGDDKFLIRGHELFAIDGAQLKPVDSAGDLRASTLVKLDPLFIQAIAKPPLFAYGDELWRMRTAKDGAIESIETTVHHDLYGDLVETTRYTPSRVTITEGKRMHVDLEIASIRNEMTDEHVRASRANPHAIYDDDIAIRELAPHVFAIELKPSDSRVFIAEFDDHVFVIEGAYDDRNVGHIAKKIRERFAPKPIRYFSFSHIHGQYVGGVRTYVGAGATVVTTPTGAEVVKEIVSTNPEIVANTRTFEDATNAMAVYNVDSQHTDDYFVFYFPRVKLLLAGDLLCYRGATTPLRGRSLNLCKTIKTLGIDVEQIQTTWPLEGYGCISPVAFGDFEKACAQ